jgi:Domain of unknown function (DUF4365)
MIDSMHDGSAMMPTNEIESELSYAYLHAISARCGFECQSAGRPSDNAGIDARVISEGVKLDESSNITSINLHVQLKATFQEPIEIDGKYSYSLTVPRYDKLRVTNIGTTRKIMAILYLPKNHEDWLSHTEESLVSKRCAYWVSLYGAPEVVGQKTTTIYIPRTQILSPVSLRDLMVRMSKYEVFEYAG